MDFERILKNHYFLVTSSSSLCEGFHISYAMAFGCLREILDSNEDISGAIPGYAKVCFCYGFEVCVALGKGKHDYNGLVRD